MFYKLIGNYALGLSAVGFSVYVYSFFIPGPRSIIILALEFSAISCPVAICGLIFDKEKKASVISFLLALFVIVFAYWIVPSGIFSK